MAAFSSRCVIVAFFLVHCYTDGHQSGNFSQVMQFVLNSSNNTRIHFHPGYVKNVYKINAWSTDATSKEPVYVVVEQDTNILSWTVPLTLANSFNNTDNVYDNTSRIFCDNGWGRHFTVTLSTDSPTNVTLYLLVKKEYNFNTGDKYSVSVSPSQPDYFFYRFSSNQTLTTVIRVNSSSDLCLFASIQNHQCPVFNLEVSRSVHQTILHKGAMRIRRYEYGEGFSLVLVARMDDSDCIQKYNPLDKSVLRENSRTSHVTVSIREINGNRTVAIFCMLGIIVVTCLVAVLVVCVFHMCGKAAGGTRYDESEPLLPRTVPEEQQDDGNERRERTLPDKLMVSHLAQNLQNNSDKSFGYMWSLLHVGIFYGLPVTQLVWTYQKIANKYGDEDMCYYNYLCANPLWIFGDFNHIYSNVGYILMGALFLCMVAHWKSKYQGLSTGVPRHYGVFNAMGLALIGEGVLSACYHVCPSQFSFQFDVTFMYLMAVLCMVQLYENRHSDVSLSTSHAFMILGAFIFIATVGLLTNEVALVAILIILEIPLCIFLSLKAYFFGPVWYNLGNLISQLQNSEDSTLHILKPQRKARFICVVTPIAINIVLSTVGCYLFVNGVVDFGTLILIQLMGNAFLHTLIYFFFKIRIYREGVSVENVFYLFLSIILWGIGGHAYFQTRTQWTESPAISRQRNEECVLFDFYDVHDLWHFWSAGALYSTFMFLLTLDDNVAYKNRNEMAVF
ncbi:SID1 transmembrane family member 1-like [Tenebrio molitor]|uniref:SID1 transmembrane family member 1-like n=1 Tax=Tenebrio molitor TaxID=7067 RepID=UPI0036248904